MEPYPLGVGGLYEGRPARQQVVQVERTPAVRLAEKQSVEVRLIEVRLDVEPQAVEEQDAMGPLVEEWRQQVQEPLFARAAVPWAEAAEAQPAGTV